MNAAEVPTPPLAFLAGHEAAVKEVAKRLALWSAPSKLPNYVENFANLKRLHDIDIFFGEPGIAIYHFVTHDDIEVSLEIDFAKLTREGLDAHVENVRQTIDRHRAQRAPLILAVKA